MLIRKYQGKSLKEIKEKSRQDLGPDAFILTITEVKPKGFKQLFSSSRLEAIVGLNTDEPECSHENRHQDIESLKDIKALLLKNAFQLMKNKAL